MSNYPGEWKLKSVEEDDQRIVWNYADEMGNWLFFSRSKPQILYWSKNSDPEKWPEMKEYVK